MQLEGLVPPIQSAFLASTHRGLPKGKNRDEVRFRALERLFLPFYFGLLREVPAEKMRRDLRNYEEKLPRFITIAKATRLAFAESDVLSIGLKRKSGEDVYF